MWWGVVPILFFLLLWCYMLAPGKSTERQKLPFLGRYIAHRGLYKKDQSIAENTLDAFDRAVQTGYGIELDVQLTRDEKVIVFHDETLYRASGIDFRPDAFTLAELLQLPLFGTDQKIPLFSKVLSHIDGKVPLIVELKPGGNWKLLCEKTRDMLRAYEGDYCVESFDPRLVRWFRKNAPEIMRGQLAESYQKAHVFSKWYIAFMMSRGLTNFLTKPQFLAYRKGKKCCNIRLAEKLGALRVLWTADGGDALAALEQKTDCIIFEDCAPKQYFSNTKALDGVQQDTTILERSSFSEEEPRCYGMIWKG